MSYTAKTDWEYDDTVTENDLNRIESGLVEAHEEIDRLKSSGVDGKARVAAAITRKRGTVAGTAPYSFKELEDGVDSIRLGTGNAQPGDVRAGKTFSNDDGPDKVGTIPVRTTTEVTPQMADVVLPAGIYDAPVTVKGGNYRVGSKINYTKLGFSKPPTSDLTAAFASTALCYGLGVDSSGNIYAARRPYLLEKYSSTGQLLISVTLSSSTGKFVRVSPDNFIYVAQTDGLSKYDVNLNLIWKVPLNVRDMDFHNEFIYLATGSACLKRLASDGTTTLWTRNITNNAIMLVSKNKSTGEVYLGVQYTDTNAYTDYYLRKYPDDGSSASLASKTLGSSNSDQWDKSNIRTRSDGYVYHYGVLYDPSLNVVWTDTATRSSDAVFLPDGTLVAICQTLGGTVRTLNSTTGGLLTESNPLFLEQTNPVVVMAQDTYNGRSIVGSGMLKTVQENILIKG